MQGRGMGKGCWVRSIVPVLIWFASSSAWAQFGGNVFRGAPAAVEPGTAPPPPSKMIGLDVGFYPYVKFKQGNFLDAEGSMFWAEQTFNLPRNDQVKFGLGGWFVFKGFDNAWQVHLKYLLKKVQFQVAALGGSQGSDKLDYSLFIILPVTETRLFKRYRANMSAGGGVYDYAATGDGYAASGFVSASAAITDRTSVDASYWVVQGKGGNPGILRYGIGVSYRF